MGVDGMNSADIFDEYFDDEKPKYIIRNCDCILSSGRCNVKSLVYCQDCTDCVLKQIVEKCKEQKVINCNIDGKEQVLKAYYHTHLGDKILELLDIQEVE